MAAIHGPEDNSQVIGFYVVDFEERTHIRIPFQGSVLQSQFEQLGGHVHQLRIGGNLADKQRLGLNHPFLQVVDKCRVAP